MDSHCDCYFHGIDDLRREFRQNHILDAWQSDGDVLFWHNL